VRRHDGVAPTSRVLAPWLIGHWLPLSLREALAEREVRRAMARGVRGRARCRRRVWGPGWLPLFRAGNGYVRAVDRHADPAPDGGVTVLRTARVSPSPPSVPSLAELKNAEWEEYHLQVSQWERDRYLLDL
jgi:hypothetical protein